MAAQSVMSGGIVYDKATEVPIIGAYVYHHNDGVVTNEFGHFSISLRDTGTITVSYLGYQSKMFKFDTKNHQLLPTKIYLDPYVIGEVVITAERNKPLEDNFGRLHVSSKELNRIPVLFGEKDPLKSLAMLPGISAGSDVSSKVFVRGGNEDQNLTLLDGGTVYNSNHLFGFFSSFNPYAIRSIDVYKGNFPAKFDGRLSSILDIHLDEGSMKEKKHSFNLGLLNSSLKFSGPLIKNKLSYLVSGRTAYPTYLSFLAGTGDPNNQGGQSYFFYDFSTKFVYKFNDNNRLSLSYYTNKDKFNLYRFSADKEGVSTDLEWGNELLNINFFRTKNKFSHTLKLNYSDYDFKFNQDNFIDSDTISSLSNNKIKEYGMRWDNVYNANKYLQFDFGIGFKYLKLVPYSKTVSRIESSGYETGIYVSSKIKLSNNIECIASLRNNIFAQDDLLRNYLNPRLSLQYLPTKNSMINLNYSRLYQPVQQISASIQLLPNELWTLANSTLPPSTSDQFSIGYTNNSNKEFDVTLELFYKRMKDLLFIKPGLNLAVVNLNTDIIRNGTGTAKGLEVLLRKKKGKLQGWLGYTLSKSDRKFDVINNGKSFPFKFDRRHDLEIALHYSLSEVWSINSNFIWQSGTRFTPLIGHIEGKPYYVFKDLYSGIHNPYNRLDISVEREIMTKKKNVSKLTFGLFNVYGVKNPLWTDVEVQDKVVKTRSRSYLLFMPSVNWQLDF